MRNWRRHPAWVAINLSLVVALLVVVFTFRVLMPYLVVVALLLVSLGVWLDLRAQSADARRVTLRTIVIPVTASVLIVFIVAFIYGLTQPGVHQH